MEKIRLQKFFTDCGVLSRRAAEKEIASGNVTVNGKTAEIGMKVDPLTDIVEIHGMRIQPRNGHCGHTYVMLNKPVGYVTTMKDEKGRLTVRDLLNGMEKRVYPVGRLDMYSEGLLLLTDDGVFTNFMTHPSHDIEKEYIVSIQGALTQKDVARFMEPMSLDNRPLRPVEAELLDSCQSEYGGIVCSSVRILLREGRNRQIRRMCQLLGYKVMRLQRIRVGKLCLGNLPLGKWRHLSEDELQYLKSMISGDKLC